MVQNSNDRWALACTFNLAVDDPEPSFNFLRTRRSAKRNFCETERYEAAVGDLTLPAICSRWVFRRQRTEYCKRSAGMVQLK